MISYENTRLFFYIYKYNIKFKGGRAMSSFIIRHGQPCKYEIINGKLSDPGLSPKGKSSVNNLLPKLDNLGIEEIFSSPLTRALKTADIISCHLNINVKIISDFEAVRIEENILEELFNSKIKWPDLWIKGLKGLESPKKLIERTRKPINSIAKNKKNTIVVAHEETVWATLVLKKKMLLSKAIKHPIKFASLNKF